MKGAIFLIAVGLIMLFLEHDATCLVMFTIFAFVMVMPDKPRRRKKNIRYIRKEFDTYEKAKHWRNGTEIWH